MKRLLVWFKSRHVSFHIVSALFVFGSVLFGVVYFLNTAKAAGCSFASTEATNSFNVAANWSCGHVPVAGDSVTIPTATTTNMLSGPVTVAGVTISGTLNIGSQILNATSLIVDVGGVATSTSGTLTVSGSGTTTNSGSIGTNSGHFLFSGNVQNNGVFDISGGNVTTTLNSTFTNAGTINGGTGSLAIAKGLVDSSGTFNAQSGTVRTFHDGHLWVANATTNNVSKIDPTTNAVVATTTVGTNPIGIVFDGNYIWVGNFTTNNVSKIDPTTNAVVATTTVGTGPRDLAFDGSHIWVTNINSNNVSKIDTTTNTVVATTTIGTGTGPFGIAFDGSHIWVVNQNSNNVSKIDITTNAVVATTTVGTTPKNAFFDGSHIWVTNSPSKSISKIDISTNTVVATISVGTSPQGIAFDGSHIWVGNALSNDVSKIDLATNAVVATTTVGTNPIGLLFDAGYIWVTNNGLNNVSKIDITTNAVVATTTVGTSPRNLAFSGSTTSTSISLPGYTYRNLQVINNHTDTISFASTPTILGTVALSGLGKLSAGTQTITVAGAVTLESGSTVTSTSGGFNFSSAVSSTGSIGSNSGNMLFSTTLQNNGRLDIGSGVVTTTGALTNAVSGTINGNGGTLAIISAWTNDGTFSPKSGTVRFAGTAVQTVTPTTYNNLTIRTTGGDAAIYSTTTVNGVTLVVSGSTFAVGTSTLIATGLITNTGTITEGVGGKIVHAAESVKLTDSSGAEASSYSTTGAPVHVVYVTVQDSNRNLLGSTIETMTMTVTLDATAGGDSETMTLTETSASSGIFRNTAALTIVPSTAIVTPGNGEFELLATGVGSVTYTDNQDASDIASDSITFSRTTASTGGSGGGGGGGGSTSPGSSGIAPSGFATSTPTTPPTAPTEPQASIEFIDPNNLPLLLATFGLATNLALHADCLIQVRSDAKSFELTLTSAEETAMCNFITYGNSTASIKFGSGERRAILRDYLDTMRRAPIWSDVERMATGRIMLVRNLPLEQQRVAKILPVFVWIFGHYPNFQNVKENLAWNTMQYRLRFPRNLTLEATGINIYRTLFLKIPATPFEWSVVRVLGYVK